MTKIVFNTAAHTSTTSAVTAAQFVTVIQELHDQLVAAGMVQTADTGQLDFSTITSIAASTNYGYRIYELDDGNSLPVFLKIAFRTGPSFSSALRQTWALDVSIGLGTNGGGTLTQSTPTYRIGAAGSYQNTSSSKAGLPLTSLICMKEGFLGVSWKQGITDGNASYAPGINDGIPIGSFFICRDTDDAGDVTADGVSLVVIAPNGTSYDNFGDYPIVAHVRSDGTVIATQRASMMPGADVVTTIDGKLPLSYLYTMTPTPRRLAQILMVGRAVNAGIGNDEMDARSVGTQLRHFIVMNSVWPADTYKGTATRACIAMLWE